MRDSHGKYLRAKVLMGRGLSLRAVGRAIGAPYSTVRYWRDLDQPPNSFRRERHLALADWRPPDPAAYAYLLGLYLGDGCLGIASPESVQLVITLDARYPEIVRHAEAAMQTSVPDAPVGTCHSPGALRVYSSHPAWLIAFPQHGPGRKHRREISLVEWQEQITHAHPKALLQGLIHSDGSRVINRFKTNLPSGRVAEYAYVRYFFTNYSTDIQRIFCEHCDLLEIRWTRSSFKNISIAHRDSVAKLDEFIGPKS